MIESRDLLYAIIVARMRNFSKASEFLHISQPALSQAIKKIENDIGLRLFIREKKNIVALTKVGELLVNDGQPILSALENLNKKISSMAVTSHETLKIGISFFYINHLLPQILAVFGQKYPDVNVNIVEANSEKLEELLIDDSVEISMLPLPLNHDKLEYQILRQEIILFAMPKDWHLHDKLVPSIIGGFPSIHLTDTQDEPYILLQNHPRFTMFQEQFFDSTNFKPQIRYMVSSWDTVSTFIEHGLGVGILPDVMLLQEKKPYPISFCRIISQIEAHRQYVIAYKSYRSLSDIAKNFIRISREILLKYNL
jgi:LysR family hydrogen peroxide-inducible transcriptional activator